MTKRKAKVFNQKRLITALKSLPNPIYDKKHMLNVYVDEGRARSNQTRVEHITKHSHGLKVKDINSVPKGIANYWLYRKDPIYKDTYNYYFKRAGLEKGLIKVSIQIYPNDSHKAWIKTIYITYRVK